MFKVIIKSNIIISLINLFLNLSISYADYYDKDKKNMNFTKII